MGAWAYVYLAVMRGLGWVLTPAPPTLKYVSVYTTFLMPLALLGLVIELDYHEIVPFFHEVGDVYGIREVSKY